jgi:hypothetical protein
MSVNLDSDESPPPILEAAADLVKAFGLEVKEPALFLPAHEVLQRLEHGEINLEIAFVELGVDLLIKHVAETTGD